MKKQLIITGFLLLTLTTGSAITYGEEQKQCVTSPRVQEEINAMETALSSLHIENKCPSGGDYEIVQQAQSIRKSLQQSFLDMLSSSVDMDTFRNGFKKLIDADENHALAHDMELYKEKIDAFDALAKQAAQACDSDNLFAIKQMRQQYYNGDSTVSESDRKGYRALRKAEKGGTYFYQEGYYTKDSPHACNAPQFEFSSIKEVWNNLMNTWKNFKEAEKKIKPRDSDTLFNEFLQEQGLMKIEDANAQLKGCSSKSTDNSYKSFFEQFISCASSQFIARADRYMTIEDKIKELKEGGKTSLTPEEIRTSVKDNEEVVTTTNTYEDRKNRYRFVYNQRAEPIDQKLQGLLVQTLLLMKGEKKLCDYTKKTSDGMAQFCEKIQTNLGGNCDDEKLKNTPCK